jgi:transcriptional regulator with XRE-family HTH domain
MLRVMRLHSYLKDQRITAEQFAAMVGASTSGVRKWLYEDRTPRPDMIAKIQEVTGGAVTFNDFIGTGISEGEPANETGQRARAS